MICALLSLVVPEPCFDRRPAPTTAPYVIEDDGGGQLLSAEADRAALLAWGGAVEIRGDCASACAIFTTLPNACLDPASRIGFHSANINLGPVGNAQVARHLRGDIRALFEAKWQFVPSDQIHWVPAETYVVLDPETRLCD